MKQVIFYSWQSDLPGSTNRYLIEAALDQAARTISNDDSLEIDAAIDRDTLGLPGAPDIITAIFTKISKADVFVADISIVANDPKGRKTPNPNVLIELGYALHALGFERMIFVYDLASGKIEDLPFDLRQKRIMTYNSSEDSSRSVTKVKLQRSFETALRLTFLYSKIESNNELVDPVIVAIETNAINRHLLVKATLKEIFINIVKLEPPKFTDGGKLEDVKYAIEESIPTVIRFSRLVELAALMKDAQVLLEIHKWFGQLFERYNRLDDYTGVSYDEDFDLYRFVGHELLVTLVSFLLREQAAEILKTILTEPIPIKYMRTENGPGEVYFYYGSPWTHALLGKNINYDRVSTHGTLLKERHLQGSLSELLPIKEFAAADYFLYLYDRIAVPRTKPIYDQWRPWSIAYLNEPPLFLKQVERIKAANAMVEFFGLSTIEELKKEIKEKTLEVRSAFSRNTLDLFLRSFDFEKIGTR